MRAAGWRTGRAAPGVEVQDLAAARADAVGEPVDERLVAALDPPMTSWPLRSRVPAVRRMRDHR